MKIEKLRRNDSCLCGSGKKYKKCCLKEGIVYKTFISSNKNKFDELEYFSLVQDYDFTYFRRFVVNFTIKTEGVLVKCLDSEKQD